MRINAADNGESVILTLVNKFRNVGKRRLRRGVRNTGYLYRGIHAIKKHLGRVAIYKARPPISITSSVLIDSMLDERSSAGKRKRGITGSPITFFPFSPYVYREGFIVRSLKMMRLTRNYFLRGLLSLYAGSIFFFFFFFLSRNIVIGLIVSIVRRIIVQNIIIYQR